ncbi:hypothetical protein QE152_g4512 [Popillia japonica]|uniref:Uncharacterized protein n=1 Tax=Popillia japonica TaxID=7064 RepID=A0AAW1N151_POPJA
MEDRMKGRQKKGKRGNENFYITFAEDLGPSQLKNETMTIAIKDETRKCSPLITRNAPGENMNRSESASLTPANFECTEVENSDPSRILRRDARSDFLPFLAMNFDL